MLERSAEVNARRCRVGGACCAEAAHMHCNTTRQFYWPSSLQAPHLHTNTSQHCTHLSKLLWWMQRTATPAQSCVALHPPSTAC